MRRSLLVLLLAVVAAPRAGAQADSSRQASTPLFGRRELVIGGAAAATALALLPFDRRIAEQFRDAGPQRSGVLHDGARVFNTLGDPGTIVFGVGTWGLGRLTHSAPLTSIGLETTEAIATSGVATALLKGLAGRQRPYLNPTDADAFALGQGFGGGGRTSFPSRHTTAAFAVASVVTAEAARWRPAAAWIAGPVLYGGAGMVGLARMYDDKHWASDVVLGGAIGTLSGLTVVRWNHAHPANRVTRWLGARAPAVAPAAHGLALVWTLRTP